MARKQKLTTFGLLAIFLVTFALFLGSQKSVYAFDSIDQTKIITPQPIISNSTYPTQLASSVTPSAPISLQPYFAPITSAELSLVDTAAPIIMPLENPSPTEQAFFPLVFQSYLITPIPTPGISEEILFCSSPNQPIPDNYSGGISDKITINDPRYVYELSVQLEVNHSWIGDLVISLQHPDSGKEVMLIDRPGIPESDYGCSLDNIDTILDDSFPLPVESECASYPSAISGMYTPTQMLNNFNGDPVAGTWKVTVTDHSPNDSGSFSRWCLSASLVDSPTQPPPPPEDKPLPDQAIIPGVTGGKQSFPLDCESRSAVDWANYYGISIGEMEFFQRLPESDNPDLGFVGNVWGNWGQIPPNDYGVHADPVAKLLRKYGLESYSHRFMRWNDVKAEIAAGNPVIVWIVGSPSYEYVVNGIPEYYSPQNGKRTIVARYEHTVILTGYTQNTVRYLNGATLYDKSIKQFLESWSALGNMAITTSP